MIKLSIRARQYVRHRAKMFYGSVVSGVAVVLIEGLEKAFDFQLGPEAKAALVGFITAPFIYWPENGPKEGTTP